MLSDDQLSDQLCVNIVPEPRSSSENAGSLLHTNVSLRSTKSETALTKLFSTVGQNKVSSIEIGDLKGEKEKKTTMQPSSKDLSFGKIVSLLLFNYYIVCNLFLATIMKYTSLVVLTLQNTALVLVMRYARTRPGPMFLSSVGVLMGEFVKLAVCLVFITYENAWNPLLAWIQLRDKVIRQPVDTLKVAVPSLIYTIQNNLLYLAVSNLDAATFQVSYQLKIFTTAIFSVAMLSKKLSRVQWFSLALLFLGVSVVQVSNMSGSSSSSSSANSTSDDEPEQSYTVGILAVLVACLLSGFAGVYFEKILKGSDLSLWLRNIQLAALSIPLALIGAFITDGQKISDQGFFVGFNWLVWGVILLQSLGGLIVAVVVKYADNILKGFATSAAIVLSCFLTWAFFETQLSLIFNLGAAFVVGAVFFYSAYPPVAKPKGNVLLQEVKHVGSQPPSPDSNIQHRSKNNRAELQDYNDALNNSSNA